MDHHALRDRLDHERRTLAQDAETIDRLPSLTRLRATDGSYHEIAWSALRDDDADDAIAAEIEHHERLGVPFEWKLYAHDPPADLLDRLRRHAFDVGPMEAVLVLDLRHPHDWIRDAANAHLVKRVTSPEQVETYRRLAEAAFGDGDDHAPIAASLNHALRAGSTQQHAYIAYAADLPVSVGRMYTHPDSAFAGLYGGATLATHRGQGFYRAVVAARALDALAAGARYLRVDALPTSRPTLHRLGFHWLTDTWPCEWRAPRPRIAHNPARRDTTARPEPPA
jgi:hypothetical protein